MNENEFWQLIDWSAVAGEGSADRQVALLEDALEQRSEQDIIGFDRLLHDLMGKAYSWDLWGPPLKMDWKRPSRILKRCM